MAASSSSSDLDHLVNGWCARYDALSNGMYVALVSGVGIPIPCQPLCVQFIRCGGDDASSNILTWVAMQCVDSCRPDLRIELRSVIEAGYREFVRVAPVVCFFEGLSSTLRCRTGTLWSE